MSAPLKCPRLPIEGRSFETWCDLYRKELSAHYHKETGRYLETDEWIRRSREVFDENLEEEAKQ